MYIIIRYVTKHDHVLFYIISYNDVPGDRGTDIKASIKVMHAYNFSSYTQQLSVMTMSTRRLAIYGYIFENEVETSFMRSTSEPLSLQEAGQQSTEDSQPGNKKYGCCVYLQTLLVYFFTDWPWETVESINMAVSGDERPATSKRSCRNSILWSTIILLRLSLVTTGLVVQLLTCFRRDRISTDLTPMGPNNTTQLLSCTEKDDVICALLIPDLIIFLLAF